MNSTDDIKSQRDRYIAFSLAAADLLIEVDFHGHIVRSIGATNALLSENSQNLKGRAVTELFPATERAVVNRLLLKARSMGRIDPTTVKLQPEDRGAIQINLGACFLPEPNCTYLTVTVLSDALAQALPPRDDITGLINAGDFQHMAAKAIKPTDPNSGTAMLREMQLIRLQGLSGAMERMPVSRSQQLMGEIGALLRANSSGSASQLGDEEFGILSVSGKGQAAEAKLNADIDEALSAAGVAKGSVSSSVVTLSMDTSHIDKDSVAKALAYVVENFTKGAHTDARSLQENLNAAMSAAVDQYGRVKSILQAGEFKLVFQPVVDLKTRQTHHYEALMRFNDGMDAYDTVRFSEQVGLATEFDLAVLKKVLAAITQYPTEFIAVNVSGMSVQNEPFRAQFNDILRNHGPLKGHVLIELTESHLIENTDAAADFLISLRKRGFRICLDDFGAGASAYNYLRRFDVDFVKIDGPFLTEALTNPRQKAIIHSLSILCQELKTGVIGEMIETEPAVKMATELGIGYGQGYLFGKPLETITPRPAPIPVAARRMGEQETWG
jgi:EAL domain-containing protein (putative c-di-GMP-specific phosphodiesterase class I)